MGIKMYLWQIQKLESKENKFNAVEHYMFLRCVSCEDKISFQTPRPRFLTSDQKIDILVKLPLQPVKDDGYLWGVIHLIYLDISDWDELPCDGNMLVTEYSLCGFVLLSITVSKCPRSV